MNNKQKYLFDLQGFLVVEDVLSDAQCDLATDKIKQRMKPMEKTPNGYASNGTWHSAANLWEVGDPFINLIDHPKVVDVLGEIIAPQLRCESSYSFVRYKDCPVFEMHGGNRGGRVNFRYDARNGQIFTGLTVVSYNLHDVAQQDGGFSCIPGSHKADFELTAEEREELFAFGGPLVQSVPAPRGAAVIFTETLAHGAGSWQRDDVPRYGLFYKYNDRAAIYHEQGSRRPSDAALAMMTDEQRCYFNTAWQAFGPDGRNRNDAPEFGEPATEAAG
jgi:hypothetical protein